MRIILLLILILASPAFSSPSCPAGWVPVAGVAQCVPCSANEWVNQTRCDACQVGSFSLGESENCVAIPGEQVGFGRLSAEIMKIRPSDGVRFDRFGLYVDVCDEVMVINNYVYEKTGGSWNQTMKLPINSMADVACGDGVIAIEFDHTVLLFGRNVSSGIWSLSQVISGDYHDSNFGSCISISGNTLVVGDYGDYQVDVTAGALYVFERNVTTNLWNRTAKLLTDLHDSEESHSSEFLGSSCAVSSDIAVAGAYGYKSYSGAAFVYSRDPTTGSWNNTFVLTASDAKSYDNFGFSVSVTGSSYHHGTCVVGATGGGVGSGAVYFLDLDFTSKNWTELAKFVPSDLTTVNKFAESVAISGDITIVGAQLDDDHDYNAGAVYVYEGGPSWRQTRKLLPSQALIGSEFGRSVAIRGTRLLIGAPVDDGEVGAAYLYDCDCGSYSTAGVCTLCPQQTASQAIGASQQQACLACPTTPSTLLSYGLCECTCPPGTYTNVNKTECIACMPGTASNITGALDVSSCVACQSGFAAGVGASVCERCRAGTYASEGQTACVPCPSGTSSAVERATNASVCRICQPGTAALAGSSKCQACGQGYIALHHGMQACDHCPIDHRWLNSTSTCIRCQPGSYSNIASVKCTAVADSERLAPSCLTYELTPSDPFKNDRFGYSVAVSGNTVAISSPLDDDRGSASGSVYIFQRSLVTGVWTQHVKLRPNDGTIGDQFGNSLSLIQSYLAVGAVGNEERGSGSGTAYVFKRRGTTVTWDQVRIDGSQKAYDSFGVSVGVGSNGVVVVGAPNDDTKEFNAGCVYMFEPFGDKWNCTARLYASDAAMYDNFGTAVAIDESGTEVLVGLSTTDAPHTGGAVYVFQRSGWGNWVESQKIIPPDSQYYDKFGVSVSLSHDVAVIGATQEGHGNGKAYVYEKNSTTGQWYFSATLVDTNGEQDDEFGISVTVSNTILAVGQKDGPVSVYLRVASSGTWDHKASLIASDWKTRDNFGEDVAIDGSILVIGTYRKNLRAGAAWIASCCPGAQALGVACKVCDVGTIAPSIGALDCAVCPGGQSSLKGSTRCTACGLGRFSMAGGVCQQCPAGYICTAASTSSPLQCPVGTFNDLLQQTQCYPCPRPSRCTGGLACDTGYGGRLCGRCAADYFVKGDACWRCPDIPWFLIVVTVVVCVILFGFLTMRISPLFVSQLKQFVTFIQCLSLTLSIGISWPPFVTWIKTLLSPLFLDIDLASPECLVGGGVTWHVRFFLSLLVSGSIPVLILCVVAMIAGYRTYLKRNAKPAHWKRFLALTKLQIKMSRLLFLVIAVCYVPLTKYAVKAFVCMASPGGVSVLAEDTSISCHDSSHQLVQGISIVILIVITGFVPLLLSFTSVFDVIRHPGIEGYRRLDKREILSCVFEVYSPSHSYFEGIVMVKKVAFVIVVTAFGALVADADTKQWASMVQAILLTVISAAYLTSVIILRPFVPAPMHSTHGNVLMVTMLNLIEIASNVGILLNSVLAIFMSLLPDSGWSTVANIAVSIYVSITTIGTVIAMIFPFAYKRYFSRSMFKDDDTTTTDYSLTDPRNLLGPADGRWLMALQEQLDDILRSKDVDPKKKGVLAGACVVWIDRISGRLRGRREMAKLFHPDTELDAMVERPTEMEVNGDVIELERLKFGRAHMSQRL